MKRVVIKVGSSSLTGTQGCLVSKKMDNLVEQIVRLQIEQKCQVILVSSGAVAVGLESLGWSRQITLSEKQAAAAVGQGLLIEKYRQSFATKGLKVAQLLLTRSDIEDRKRFIHIRNTIETLLCHRVIPIINENDTVTVEEIEFGDNDTLGGFVALVSEAEQLIMLTDIDGLYTANPRQSSNAERIEVVHKITPAIEALASGKGSAVGTGGMRTKIRAAKMVTHAGVEAVIAATEEPDVLGRIVQGEYVGTRFSAKERMPSKKSWLAYSTRSEGRVIIDAGAADALINQCSSLLLAGVQQVRGHFAGGAVVDIVDGHEQLIGKGLINFSDRDLAHLLLRRATGERLTAYHECIHRDQLVILTKGENQYESI